MSETEVFRPTQESIALRGNLSHGLGQSADVFRKPVPSGSRLPSRSGSRFGNLSYNSFFARHNPHPGRVKHLKGLLDVPICAVNDEMIMANPRYSYQFPPDTYNQAKIHHSAINVNSQSIPINTITGLQHFLGKPLNFRIYGGTMEPRQGMGAIPEAWQDELKSLMAGIGPAPQDQCKKQEERRKTPMTGRPKTQYSETTGRLIPPPSRAMSRGFSRQGQRQERFMQNMADQFNMEATDMEDTVMTLLCQILQTDDLNAVQHWLVSAGDREKILVQNMLKAALESQEEYNRQPQYEIPPVTERPVTGILGDSDDVTKRIDRISLEPSSPRPRTVNSATKLPPIGEQQEQVRPPTSDAFRPSSSKRVGSRPASRLATPKPPTPAAAGQEVEQPRLKYTSSNENRETWKQDDSTVQK